MIGVALPPRLPGLGHSTDRVRQSFIESIALTLANALREATGPTARRVQPVVFYRCVSPGLATTVGFIEIRTKCVAILVATSR